jgi:hypothetical protein
LEVGLELEGQLQVHWLAESERPTFDQRWIRVSDAILEMPGLVVDPGFHGPPNPVSGISTFLEHRKAF